MVLRKFGEVAFGAELVSVEYLNVFQKARKYKTPLITSPCPAIVSFIQKHYPKLVQNLAPIVSPMIATAKAIRAKHGNDAKVVFIGPCIAKKDEILDPALKNVVDVVITFLELKDLFDKYKIKLDEKESSFDGPRSYYGRSYAISGGLLKAAGISSDILDNDVIVSEGKERIIETLNSLNEGKSNYLLYDLLFCEGCINGPGISNDASYFVKRERVANYVNHQNIYSSQRDVTEGISDYSDLDLKRHIKPAPEILRIPTEEEIFNVLKSVKKDSPQEQLNCGACGYPTCREKAIAVCQGLAENEMCLPYLVDKLESTLGQLLVSHKRLDQAQQKLVQTEKLASMGQLSAGVAHELNNPLGTILLYSHMLLKQLGAEEKDKQDDIKMIVSEATRCKDIVRGLLDFARQSRVSKSVSNLTSILNDIYAIFEVKASDCKVKLIKEIDENIPEMNIDKAQIKQALINIVSNGIDAMEKGGTLTIKAIYNEKRNKVDIKISDTGCGIPDENLKKLFSPFFTTKDGGKGTGLGLAITYGIVKMHSGAIFVDSKKDIGTTFTISLPITSKESEETKIDDTNINNFFI